MWFLTKLVFGALVVVNVVYSQGEDCYLPDNTYGICQILPNCPSLLRLYQFDRSRNTVNFLVGAQRNCGNRSYRRDPILCCSDGLNNDQNPAPVTDAPTPPPTPAPTQPPTQPPTQRPTATNAPATRQDACVDPNGVRGSCINIYQCPSVLDEFQRRKNDPDYVKFIQASNKVCSFVGQNICCPVAGGAGPAPATQAPPTKAATNAPVNTGARAKLLRREEGCGFSNVKHNRVVGGVPASQGGWPWMALIGYKNQIGEVSFKCGGSLITSQHVLTAAHCIRNDLSSVRLGEHDLSTETEATTVDIPVVKIEMHPQYDKKDGHSDLAILHLGEKVTFTNSIKPICIPIDEPVRSKNFVGYNPFVAGWGRTQEGGTSAKVLQELQLPVLENADCKTRYQKIGKLIDDKQFDNKVLCAGDIEGGKDSCQGDSGGPLMQPQTIEGNAYFYQIGVVSYGIGCARAEIPGVYTSVQAFAEWIKERVDQS